MEIKPIGKNEISFPTRVHIKSGMVYEPSTGTIIPTWTLRNYDFHVDTFVPSSRLEETNEEDNDTDTSSLDTRSPDEYSKVAQKILEVYKIQRVRM